MKVVALLILSGLMTSQVWAQNTVKRFCEVSVYGNVVKLNYGQSRKYTPFKDSVFVNKLRRVESLDKLVAVLNYMSDFGWKYEWSIPEISGYNNTSTTVRVLFSKEFDRSALIDQVKVEGH